jgi:NAD(P)-dependent dehydrogenase (short-subunit alcohol dehydrogenase family)
MANKAALVTGASSGIGLAIANLLGSEGYDLTVAARRPEKLEEAANGLREKGYNVLSVAANMQSEEDIIRVVDEHRSAYGRLDVLVNNAGVGVGSAVGDYTAKAVDMQMDVNFRAIVLFYRECVEMLRASAAENKSSLVVNTSSISGKFGQGWLSVYSATKHAVVGFTQAMNKELSGEGIKNTALCPAFVDTPMTDFVKGQVSAEEMITPDDIAEGVRMLLHQSPACIVPEIIFQRPGEDL